jgi:hypothetical protein
MLLTRISRGAARAKLHVQHKMRHSQVSISSTLRSKVKGAFLALLVLRTVLLPVPLVAPATVVAAGNDDPDPSLQVVRVSTAAQNAVTLTRTEDTSIAILSAALTDVTVGTSIADERAAAEARRQAEEEAAARAKAEADKKQRALAAVKSAPSDRPTVSPDKESVRAIIVAAAEKYQVSSDLLLRIAMCESGLNPTSKNRSSAASGLFQFMPGTYRNSPSGAAGLSIWDAQANAEAAAFKIANGALRAWNASKHCWNR